MKYTDPELRDHLASAYVLGTLTGRARTRFESLLKYDACLREQVQTWETRLAPLALAIPDVTPPMRLWQRISNRAGLGNRLNLSADMRAYGWRVLAAIGVSTTLVLALYIGGHLALPPVTALAVMSDEQGRAGMVLSWPDLSKLRDPQIRLRTVQDHPAMALDTVLELWLLSDNDEKNRPQSLGTVVAGKDQAIKLNAEQASAIKGAWGFALSIEPKNGSSTGQPAGPIILKGRALEL